MNPDPTRPEPGDDLTAAAADADLVDAIALDAVTAAAEPLPEEDPTTHDESDPMVGRRLGAYRLMERMAIGTGAIYRAARIEAPEQQVAITILGHETDGAAIVRRFRDEVRVHAALSKHPHIAGLLDAGTTEDGRPYFVTAYADGRRIDEYCDGHRLDIPARLRLFAQVCDAVQIVHQHAVIHRDLKPGHILVTADGVPKLIVFDIPAPADPGADEADGSTHVDLSVVTPEYASPEQVTCEPLTTASDVYALGVVLYRLLTGRRPYRLETQSAAEVFQAICEQAPERPSRAVVRRPAKPAASDEPGARAPNRTGDPDPAEVAAARGMSPRRLGRLLAGDLDAIVLTAMRHEPERRYASAGPLADDLRRYLDGRPVMARGNAPVYRAGKFVRRHTAAVVAVAAVMLAIVAGVVGTTRGLIHARRDRDRAVASSREVRRAVDQFFDRIGEERRLDQPGLLALREELLRDARRFYEAFLVEHAGDPTLGAELAGARSRLGAITAAVGSPALAAEQLQQAVALWDGVLRSQPRDPESRLELARTLNERAAVLMRLKGRRDEALDDCRRARALIEPLAGAASAPASLRRLLGQVLQNTAQLRFEQGQPREAIEALLPALETQRRLVAEEPRALDPRIGLARALGLMGQVLAEQPDESGPALAFYQQAVEILDAITREQPGLADQAYLLAMDLDDVSALQQRTGQLDSALASVRRAIEILERLDRQYPGVLNYQGGLAGSYNLISDLHRRRLEPAESLAFAEKARALLERLVAEHPEDTASRVDLARSDNNIGRMHQRSGEPAEALRAFQRAVDLLEGLPELDARNRYSLACNLALSIPMIGAREGSQGVHDPEALSKGDQLRRRLYGDRAIEVLRRAVRGGSFDAEVLQSDPDLAAIRDRDDFQAIAKEVETPAEAGRK